MLDGLAERGVGTLIYGNEYQQIRRATKRDVRLMMIGARKINVPLLIGTAGTGGTSSARA